MLTWPSSAVLLKVPISSAQLQWREIEHDDVTKQHLPVRMPKTNERTNSRTGKKKGGGGGGAAQTLICYCFCEKKHFMPGVAMRCVSKLMVNNNCFSIYQTSQKPATKNNNFAWSNLSWKGDH